MKKKIITQPTNMTPITIIILILISTNISEEANISEEPLILTDYINKNQTDQAKSKCAVHHNEFFNKTSCSGYFRISEVFNSCMFFWFFPAEENYETAPVVLWLQGGPGDTTFISLLYENGPFVLDRITLRANEYSWTKNVSMLYVDNPVGTGFSHTEGGYCENQTQVGEDLYATLQQFFQVFPELINNDFFIAGVSYGGKYAMAIAHTIHVKNPTANIKINLKGISSGNGVIDPEHETTFSEYFYQLGLIDLDTKEKMEILEKKAANATHEKEYNIGMDYMNQAILSLDSLFVNASGFQNPLYNYLDWNYEVNYTDIREFLARPDIRKALHVGNNAFQNRNFVIYYLWDETMVSVAPWMSELLSHYRILVYNGQLDLIVPYPVTVNYLRHLNFSGSDSYMKAKRFQWYHDGDLAGYVKQAGNLTEVLVRNAGHMAIHDQPAWMYGLFSGFFRNETVY